VGGAEERPLVDFDHYDPQFGDRCWSQYEQLRRECPVAYSETYGGFWLLSKYDDVRAVALDDRAFSSAQSVTVPGKPAGARHAIPIEVDPPLFSEYRRALNPWFSPAAIARMEPTISMYVSELIDGFIERGRCDLVSEFANPLPAMTTLALLGLDPADWEIYVVPVHAKTFLRPEKTKTPEFSRLYEECHRRIRSEIQARRSSPRDDMITALLKTRIGGEPISDDDLQDIVMLILHGGFDTTGSAIGNAMIYMDGRPELRELLRSNPDLLPLAVEDFLRHQAPQPGLARVATTDRVIRRQRIRKGDRVLLLWASANRDEDEFERADEVVPDRHPNRHLTFGIGLHRCVGAPLASAEIRIALEAILRRLPDYHIETEGIVRAETVGIVFGHFSIPMTYTPGRREHDPA
jgi:cytochrome P450